MNDESPTTVYLEAISILAAALRDIRDAYPPGHFGHDRAHEALDKADRIQPSQPEPQLRYALVEQMGHRSTIATIRETTFAGKQMIEAVDLKGGGTSLISPESIYEITWITEADAIARTAPWTPPALTAGNPNPWGAYGADDYDDGTLPDPENPITGRTAGALDDDYPDVSGGGVPYADVATQGLHAPRADAGL